MSSQGRLEKARESRCLFGCKRGMAPDRRLTCHHKTYDVYWAASVWYKFKSHRIFSEDWEPRNKCFSLPGVDSQGDGDQNWFFSIQLLLSSILNLTCWNISAGEDGKTFVVHGTAEDADVVGSTVGDQYNSAISKETQNCEELLVCAVDKQAHAFFFSRIHLEGVSHLYYLLGECPCQPSSFFNIAHANIKCTWISTYIEKITT